MDHALLCWLSTSVKVLKEQEKEYLPKLYKEFRRFNDIEGEGVGTPRY